MAGSFELFKDNRGEFRFRLKASNYEIILRSEGYTNKDGAKNGITSVKNHAPYDSNYDRKNSANDKYYFNLIANNNQIIGTSEQYESKSGRDNGIESVKNNAPNAPIVDKT